MAARKLLFSRRTPDASWRWTNDAAPFTAFHPTITRMVMPASFMTISVLWTLLPDFTPRQLITVRTPSVVTAMIDRSTFRPVSSRK